MSSVSSARGYGFSLAWVGWLVIAGLMLSSGMVWKLTREREDQRLFDKQQLFTESLQKNLQERLASVDEPLHWNAQWFRAAGSPDRKRFEAFNATLLERAPSVQMLEWTPRVWFADRDRWIRAARIEVAPDFDILEPDGTGMLRPSRRGAEYYLPVLYSVTRPGMDAATGLNVNYSADRRSWYEDSARNASPITTGVIPIFGSAHQPSKPGFVYSWPFYAGATPEGPDARWERVIGWMAAVVTLEELFVHSLDRQLMPEFDVLVYELSAAGRFLIAERSLSRTSRVSLPEERFESAPDDMVRTVLVGERSWGVVVRPTPLWYRSATHGESTRILVISLVFTALIALSLWRQMVGRRRNEVLQAHIAAREALLRDVTNGVPVVVYQARTIADGEPRITFVSDQVQKMLGVTESDVLQDANNFYRHVDTSDTPRPALAQAARGQDPAEVYRIRLGGTTRWVEHRALERLPDGPGARVTTGYWSDVTELKIREQQLIHSMEQTELSRQKLQAVVTELERTRDSLVQSEKLASLGSMVAGVSHELNTPLGNALLAGSGLLQSLGDTRQRFLQGELKKSKLEKFFDDSVSAAELITRSVERAAQLVTAFKQTAIDQTHQERQQFDLARHLESVLDSARTRYLDAPWNFSLTGSAQVVMDSFPKPLQQIIHSMIDNCVQHGFRGRSQGNVEIAFRLMDAATEQEDWVEIVLTDDGCGIEAAIASRVFDPFFTTRMGRHVGMGLNVVHRMTTTVLGGNIFLSAGEGQGARFVMHLPRAAPHII